MAKNHAECPKCGSYFLVDVSGKYNAKSGATGAGIGALGGFLLGGPIGLLIGAGLGATVGTPSSGIDYQCQDCGKRFSVCPSCKEKLILQKYSNLPAQEGYKILSGARCRKCGHIFSEPRYQELTQKDYDDYDDYNDDDY